MIFVAVKKTLESSLDCKIKPVNCKKINPEYSLEGLMLKLKLWYFAHLCEELTHWKRPWCWEWLREGGEGEGWGWDGWMASPTQWTWLSEWTTEDPKVTWQYLSHEKVHLESKPALCSPNSMLSSSAIPQPKAVAALKLVLLPNGVGSSCSPSKSQ